MAFMEPEMTDKQWWLYIDGNEGGEYIPDDLFNVDVIRSIIDGPEDADYAEKVLAIVQTYCRSRDAYSAELKYGYGVRSSASGYLDCTDWNVYTSKREALKAVAAEKRANNGDD